MTNLKFILLTISLLALAGCSSSKDKMLLGERMAVPGSADVTGIYFVDGSEGYAATATGEVLKTTDGGKTFVQLDLGANSRARDLNFLNDDIGLAFGPDGFLSRTTDGGQTWNRIAVDSTFDLRDLQFLDKQHGFVIGVINTPEQHEVAVIGRSADKGETWTFEKTDHYGYRQLAIVPRNNLWIVGSDGMAFSTDQGVTWGFNRSQPTDTLRSLSFSDIMHGWTAGDGGVLRNSTDGGWSWKDKPLLSGRSLTRVVSPELDIIYLAGDRFLGVSTNQGRMWLVDTLNYAVQFHDCQAVGKEILVGGSMGTLIKLKR